MLERIINRLRNDIRLRRGLVLLVLLVTVGVVALLLIVSRTGSRYVLQDTGLRARQNFGYIKGQELFAYNGAAFFKQDLASGQASILSKGQKLPQPSKVFWANSKGALLNFSSSFTLSSVETALNQRGLKLNQETRGYTWYLDFATDSLKLVDTAPIDGDLANYTAEENGFYYIAGHAERTRYVPDSGLSVKFYSITQGTSETIATNLVFTGPSFLGSCSNETKTVCLVAREQDNPANKQLIKVSSAKQEKLLGATGLILPTNQPETFVNFDAEDTGDTAEEGGSLTGKARLYNLETKQTKELGLTISGTGYGAYVNGNRYYLLDTLISQTEAPNGDSFYYGAGKFGLLQRPQTIAARFNGKPFGSKIIRTNSYGAGQMALVTDYEGRQLLFTPEGAVIQLNRPEQTEVEDKVRSCSSAKSGSYDYFSESATFKVYFTQTAAYTDDIQQFTSCLLDTVKPGGYNYYFGARDSRNGRIITD